MNKQELIGKIEKQIAAARREGEIRMAIANALPGELNYRSLHVGGFRTDAMLHLETSDITTLPEMSYHLPPAPVTKLKMSRTASSLIPSHRVRADEEERAESSFEVAPFHVKVDPTPSKLTVTMVWFTRVLTHFGDLTVQVVLDISACNLVNHNRYPDQYKGWKDYIATRFQHFDRIDWGGQPVGYTSCILYWYLGTCDSAVAIVSAIEPAD